MSVLPTAISIFANTHMQFLVEHSFGILKTMFPILLYGLRKYKAINSLAAVFAAVVLYNLGRDFNEPDPILPPHMSMQDFDQMMRLTRSSNAASRLVEESKFVRNQIIANYFT